MIAQLEEEVEMLDRHLEVLAMVIEHEPIGIVKMSNETGYPHHKVRYSLRILEDANLIEPTSQGATTTPHTEKIIADLDETITDITDQLDMMKISETHVADTK